MMPGKHINILRRASATASIILFAVAILLPACSSDAYESGDGRYSYLRADFVEASTDADAHFYAADTDDGAKLNLSPTITASWANVADTTYRALLYYNVPTASYSSSNAPASPACAPASPAGGLVSTTNVPGPTANAPASSSAGNPVLTSQGYVGSSQSVEPVAIARVFMPSIIDATGSGQSLSIDALGLETAWMSKNGRYINLGIIVKTGKQDETDSSQRIGLAYTGSEEAADGTKVHHLTLLHDQNGVPEYYSSNAYVSVSLSSLPFPAMSGDRIEIAVNTYGGEKNEVFTILSATTE